MSRLARSVSWTSTRNQCQRAGSIGSPARPRVRLQVGAPRLLPEIRRQAELPGQGGVERGDLGERIGVAAVVEVDHRPPARVAQDLSGQEVSLAEEQAHVLGSGALQPGVDRLGLPGGRRHEQPDLGGGVPGVLQPVRGRPPLGQVADVELVDRAMQRAQLLHGLGEVEPLEGDVEGVAGQLLEVEHVPRGSSRSRRGTLGASRAVGSRPGGPPGRQWPPGSAPRSA